MSVMFVYGTLKSGYANSERCLKGARSLGRAVTRGTYDLFDGGFPFMAPGRTGRVAGELFVVAPDHVGACDRLEGHPGWYVRRRIWVTLQEDGRSFRVYSYVLPRDRLRPGLSLIPADANGVCEWDRPRAGAEAA